MRMDFLPELYVDLSGSDVKQEIRTRRLQEIAGKLLKRHAVVPIAIIRLF